MAIPKSQIRVNTVVNQDEDGPVRGAVGATIPTGNTFVIAGAGLSITGNAGIATATTIVGDGSALTNLDVTGPGKAAAFAMCLT